MASSLNTLPSELVEEIAWYLAPSLATINSLAQTCRSSYLAANRVLYRLDGARGSTALHWAARKGDLAAALLSLDNGGDIDAKEAHEKQRSPLALAAEFNHVALVDLFIERGADANKLSMGTLDGAWQPILTPLAIAARNGHPECVRKIIAGGGYEVIMDSAQFDTTLDARVDEIPPGTGDYLAVMGIFLDFWIRRGGTCDTSCRAALSWASRNNQVGCARLLLDCGVSPLEASTLPFTRTPLTEAAGAGHLGLVRTLIEDYKVPPDHTAYSGQETPLLRALWEGHEAVVEYLLHAGADPSKGAGSKTPLRFSIERGAMIMMEKLLRYCADDEARRNMASSAFVLAVSQGLRDAVEVLLRYGADIDAVDRHGLTALSYACSLSDSTLFDILLAGKANVNPPGAVKPLHVAASHATNAQKRMRKLIEGGADLNPRDADGLTPLMYVCKAGNLADVQVVKLLLDAGADPRATDNESSCPVAYAMAAGRSDIMRMILAKGGHANLEVEGRMELYLASAVRYGALDFVKVLVNECGADVTVKDAEGNSMLRRAILEEHVQVVNVLLEAGHEVTGEDLHIAHSQGSAEIHNALQRRARQG